MTEVGVRELRQNLSVYLRRVAAGERFVVTEHRQPVAVLGPTPESEDPWEKLLAEGRLSRPTRALSELDPPIDTGDPQSGSRALAEQREERLP
jgi:prevent-host-death family protein